MHPLLRTLDLRPILGMESSVYDLQPIRTAGPSQSRGIPLLVSLGLTPLLIYGLGLSLNRPASMLGIQSALNRAQGSVTLVLHELEVPPVQGPARDLVGPEGPGGAGHREGTNTLDPRLLVHTSILSSPSEAIDPDDLSTSTREERASLSLNPALPQQPGGNGLARGTGRDAASGSGGLKRAPVQGSISHATPDFKLVAIRKVELRHQMSSGDEGLRTEPSRVRILIGEDGIPFQATWVSGPWKLREKAIRTALGWRFEPLDPHGLKAPLSLVLTFHPR
ncbi:MAG: hypothetical protein U0P46_12715 [Holophagaceae bacterium]